MTAQPDIHPLIAAAIELERVHAAQVAHGILDVQSAQAYSAADCLFLANQDDCPEHIKVQLVAFAVLHAVQRARGLHAVDELNKFTTQLETWDGTPPPMPDDFGNDAA